MFPQPDQSATPSLMPANVKPKMRNEELNMAKITGIRRFRSYVVGNFVEFIRERESEMIEMLKLSAVSSRSYL